MQQNDMSSFDRIDLQWQSVVPEKRGKKTSRSFHTLSPIHQDPCGMNQSSKKFFSEITSGELFRCI